MTRLTLFIIIFSTLITFGQTNKTPVQSQKTLSDSISLDFIPYGIESQFVLTKVRQFNGQEIYDLGLHQLFFDITDTSIPLNPGCVKSKIADTIMLMSWDSNEKEIHNTTAHLIGIVTFNRSTKIIVTKVAYRNRKTKNCEYYTKLYKIKKMTHSEIILLDITNYEFKRTFYFHRKSPM